MQQFQVFTKESRRTKIKNAVGKKKKRKTLFYFDIMRLPPMCGPGGPICPVPHPAVGFPA